MVRSMHDPLEKDEFDKWLAWPDLFRKAKMSEMTWAVLISNDANLSLIAFSCHRTIYYKIKSAYQTRACILTYGQLEFCP